MSQTPKAIQLLDRARDYQTEHASIVDVVDSASLMSGCTDLFFSSGTTCSALFSHIMALNTPIRALTNSTLIVASHSTLAWNSDIHLQTVVGVLSGDIDPATGLIKHKDSTLKKDPKRRLFFATRGVDEKGLSCLHNEVELKSILDKHNDIVILATLDKLGQRKPHKLKDMGQIKRDIENRKRKYALVVPSISTSQLSKDQEKAILEVRIAYQNAGVSLYPDI